MSTKIYIILAILLIIAGAFYWFSVRPANIRSSCGNEASQTGALGGWTPSEINSSYENCIHSHGLLN
jgi:uncharacterized membrane protein